MRYFILGYMGSGKTTLGRALGQHLEVDFIDLDALITSEIGSSIVSFMEDKGELAFRKVEHNVLERFLNFFIVFAYTHLSCGVAFLFVFRPF